MTLEKVIFIAESGLEPYKKHYEDAGWDLRAAEEVTIEPLSYGIINTKTRVIIPKGYYGQIQARSGLAVKNGIITMAGVIDATYRGEIKVVLFNASREPFKVHVGDRIAQLIVLPVYLDAKVVHYDEVDLEEFATNRNEHGFGSTGLK